MTTVAYDGRMLASDKMANYGSTAIECTKIFKTVEGLLVGASGELDNTLPFKEWVLGGRDPKSRPTLTDAFSGIVIELNGAITYYTFRLVPSTITRKQWALGSGSDYALGAMAAGKNAEQAICIATELDTNTGMGVDVLIYKNGGET